MIVVVEPKFATCHELIKFGLWWMSKFVVWMCGRLGNVSNIFVLTFLYMSKNNYILGIHLILIHFKSFQMGMHLRMLGFLPCTFTHFYITLGICVWAMSCLELILPHLSCLALLFGCKAKAMVMTWTLYCNKLCRAMYIVDTSLKSKLELWKGLNLEPTNFVPPLNHSPILGKIT